MDINIEKGSKEKKDSPTVLRVNLKENKVISYRLNEKADPGVKERLEKNNDYRQGMLSYVLEHLKDSDKERVIQTLMPERLMAQLNFRNKVTCDYQETRNGELIFFRMEIVRAENNPDEILIEVTAQAEEKWKKKEYIVGNDHIFMMGDMQSVEEILRADYTFTNVENVQTLKSILQEKWNETAAIVISAEHVECEESIRVIRANDLYKTIPAVILADVLSESEKEHYLELGAAELISQKSSGKILKNRIKNVIQCHELTETVRYLEKDSQTGIYNKESFYRYSAQVIQQKPDDHYEADIIQIANIRALQKKYGDAVTGMVINFVIDHIRQELPGIIIFGRFADGEFAVLRRQQEACDYNTVLNDIRSQAPIQNLALKAGIAYAEKNDTIKKLCERAQRVIDSIVETYGVRFAVYDEKMRQNDRKVQNILDNMEIALEQGQFDLYYQPKHCVVTENVCGAEALVRWIHPEYGFMNPGEFIPIFERVGFIRGLDRYIFGKVCGTIAKWKNMGIPIVPISINLSRRDFETEDLADWILQLTGRMGIEPKWIHIEVTETAYTDSPEQISLCLHRLHEAGFEIELDDFGVGYSSLTTLNDIDIDILKLDRSIIAKDVRGEGKSILEFCMQLAKLMKLKTVAEGIETEEQRKRMCELGCDYIQGYYYSRPMPLEEFEKYLRERQPKEKQ